MARPRRWSHQHLLILLFAASPASAQTRPERAEIGIDVGLARLVTAFGDQPTGYAATAHGGWETKYGLAPELEMGLASWSGIFANESTFWFAPGLRYTAEVDRFGFFAATHLGYGHIDGDAATGVSGGGLAIDFAAGLFVRLTPDVAAGPRLAFTHIDLFRTVPVFASELWWEIGAGLLITLPL